MGGAALETILDNHLGGEKIYTLCTRPSFLEHPDLDIGDMPPGLGSPAPLASSGEIQGDQQPEQGDEPENPFATSQNPTKYYQSESNFSLSISPQAPRPAGMSDCPVDAAKVARHDSHSYQHILSPDYEVVKSYISSYVVRTDSLFAVLLPASSTVIKST